MDAIVFDVGKKIILDNEQYIAVPIDLFNSVRYYDLQPEDIDFLLRLFSLPDHILLNKLDVLSFLFNLNETIVQERLDKLIEMGLIHLIDQSLEEAIQKPLTVTMNKKKSRTSRKESYTEEFLNWWEVYPRHDAKRDAFKAWQQVKTIRPPLEKLLELTKKYALSQSDTEKKFIPLPASWLRGERWDDDIEAPKTVATAMLTEVTPAKLQFLKDRNAFIDHKRWLAYKRYYMGADSPMSFERWLSYDTDA